MLILISGCLAVRMDLVPLRVNCVTPTTTGNNYYSTCFRGPFYCPARTWQLNAGEGKFSPKYIQVEWGIRRSPEANYDDDITCGGRCVLIALFSPPYHHKHCQLWIIIKAHWMVVWFCGFHYVYTENGELILVLAWPMNC